MARLANPLTAGNKREIRSEISRLASEGVDRHLLSLEDENITKVRVSEPDASGFTVLIKHEGSSYLFQVKISEVR